MPINEKKHKAREIQLERQMAYFEKDLNQKIKAMKSYMPKVAKDQMRLIAIYAYKRGRLDR